MTLKEASNEYKKSYKTLKVTVESIQEVGSCQASHVEAVNDLIRDLFHCSEKMREEE